MTKTQKKNLEKTIKTKLLFLKAFEKKAGNVKQSCVAVGVSRQTYYRWCDTDDTFSDSVQEVRESLVDFAEGALLALIREKHAGAVMFFLKTQGKHRGYCE